ncbi:hypothetical protein [Microbulbifer hainanensis]|uniref:hypothetical protein n=1 Tax=Microbulbifer hainanensis TaxID=2735675 RepID=UPI001865C867|nr:hypothetical protein [Microbulbifer hainanensis]
MGWKNIFSAIATSVSLTACGGGGGSSGGGDDTISPPNNPAQYSVSTAVQFGGSIVPANATVESGDTVAFTITPRTGYQVSTASGCGGTLDGLTYTTGSVTGNCEVSVTFETKTRAVPTSFVIDPANRRLIGQLWQMPSDAGWYNPFVVMGLDDDSYDFISVSDNFPYCGLLALNPARNEVICPEISDSQLKLTAVDMSSGVQRLLLGTNLSIDPAEWSYAMITDVKASADNTSLYLMLVYMSAISYDKNRTVIFRYDFADGSLTKLIDGYAQSGAKVAADTFALADNGILTINSQLAGGADGDDHLSLIDYAGADVSDISAPFNLNASRVTIGEGSNAAYVVGYNGIAKADIAAGTQQVLSLESEEQLFGIDQLGSVVLDKATNRILVGDSSFDYIFAVDTETGERFEFAENGIGTGRHLLAPRAIELDESNQRAFVLDDGGNTGETLFEIDLVTGDRTALARFNLAYNYVAQDLVLDIAGGRIFAVFDDEVYVVALADGTITPLTGGGYQFTGASLDEAGNRLLVTDAPSDSVLAIDLATNNMTGVFSSPDIDAPVDVELDDTSGLMYILSQGNGQLRTYDPDTGTTALLLDSCLEDKGRNAMDPSVGTVQAMVLDPNNPLIWISGDYLMRFNLETKSCSVMPHKYYGNGLVSNLSIMDAEAASDGKLFGTKFNYVVQIDFESGELEAISR